MKPKIMKKLLFILFVCGPVAWATLSTDYAPVSYDCIGATSFAFPHTFFSTTDLLVYHIDEDGTETLLEEGSEEGDYSVYAPNRDYSSGATITTISTYTNGRIVVARSIPYGQGLSIGGDFVPAKPLETQLDKLAAQTQQLKDLIGRTLVAPVTDPPDVTLSLPNAKTRANQIAYFSTNGSLATIPFVNSGIIYGDGVTVDISGENVISVKNGGIDTAQLANGAVDADKLADDAVTTEKLASPTGEDTSVVTGTAGANGKLVKWNSDGDAVDSGFNVIDDDTMATATSTNIPTSESVKAYADSKQTRADFYAMKYSGATVFTGAMPTSFTDLNLSSTIGSNRCFVFLSVSPDAATSIITFRVNGETKTMYTDISDNDIGASGCIIGGAGDIGYLTIITDSSGIVEWDSNQAGSGGTVVKLLTYQVLQ